MAQAQKGDRVKIEYTGKLADGTVFDSTLEGGECSDDCCDTDEHDAGDCGCGCDVGPMELTVGAGELFPQIDDVLVGMSPGEKTTVVIPAVDAFGDYDEEKVFTVPRSDLPDDLVPEVGEELILTNDDEEELGAAIIAVDDDSVTFDANHPLAGHDLTFELELVEILS